MAKKGVSLSPVGISSSAQGNTILILFASVTNIIFKPNTPANSNSIIFNSKIFFNNSRTFIPIRPILSTFLKFKSILYIIRSNPSNTIKLTYILYLTAEAVIITIIIIITVTAIPKNSIINILIIRIIVVIKISFLIITVRRKTLNPSNLIRKLPLKNIIYYILINIIKSYSIKRPILRTSLPNTLKFCIFIFI